MKRRRARKGTGARIAGEPPCPTAKRRPGRPPKIPKSAAEMKAACRALEKASPDSYVSPNMAGQMLGLTGEAVKQWIYRRRLPAAKLSNGYWRIKAADLRAFVRSRNGAGIHRVLLADAGSESVSAIQKVLEELGHGCTVAHNLLDALLKAADTVPAIILVNLSCPGMDGWKLAKRLRGTDGTKRVPLIFFSSEAETEEDVSRALALGAQGFLRQPIEKDVLKREIRRCLGGTA